MKVMIADDDRMTRFALGRIVEDLGHDCVETKDGSEAWRTYRNATDIDVIISDWMMPGINGLELCRRVRATDRKGYTFFIFLTVIEDNERLLEGMRAGADEYLTKPLDSDELRAKLMAASRTTSFHEHLDERLDSESLAKPDQENGHTVEPGPYRLPGSSRPRAGSGRFWDLLISQGKLDEEQLQQALDAQKNDRRELGKVLVSLEFISEADLAQAQAERLNLDYVELPDMRVDPVAVGLVPEKVLRQHAALPLYMEGKWLVVAMSDPTNVYALEDLKMLSGRPVIPVVATETDIRRTQNKAFAQGEQVSGILEEAAEETTEARDELSLGAGSGADEPPVVRLVNSILQQAVSDGASDIHLQPQAKELVVRFRVDGVLRKAMSIPPKLQSGVLARLKILANLNIAERRIPQDGRFSLRLGGQKVDLRVASLPTAHGEEIVLRLLDASGHDADLPSLGFPPKVLEGYRKVFGRPYGAILVTGPTGSGKSTTLYATLRELNSVEKKIVTVEDPIEYLMPGISQVQVNIKAGLTFASGLRSLLRNDPDIVMVGEIRDFETAKTSVEAALTGHLVLATLHTNDAPGALPRLANMGVEPFLTASAVDCVISQRLARRLCESCRQPVEVAEELLKNVRFPFGLLEGEAGFHGAVGCERCDGMGYQGRIGLYEAMMVTDEIEEMVMRRAPTEEIARAASRDGMVRLREDGLLKAARGITTIEEVLRTVV